MEYEGQTYLTPPLSTVFSNLFWAVALEETHSLQILNFSSKMNTWGSRELWNTPAGEGQTHLFYLLTSATQRK